VEWGVPPPPTLNRPPHQNRPAPNLTPSVWFRLRRRRGTQKPVDPVQARETTRPGRPCFREAFRRTARKGRRTPCGSPEGLKEPQSSRPQAGNRSVRVAAI
jgi:hypothetical protein